MKEGSGRAEGGDSNSHFPASCKSLETLALRLRGFAPRLKGSGRGERCILAYKAEIALRVRVYEAGSEVPWDDGSIGSLGDVEQVSGLGKEGCDRSAHARDGRKERLPDEVSKLLVSED